MELPDLLSTGSTNTANTKLTASSSYKKLPPSDTAAPFPTSVSQHTGAAQLLCSVQLLGSSNPEPLGRLCQAAIEVRKVNSPPLHRGTASLILPPPPSKNGFQVCWVFDLGFVRVSGYNSTANRRRTWRGQHQTVPGLLRKKRPL